MATSKNLSEKTAGMCVSFSPLFCPFLHLLASSLEDQGPHSRDGAVVSRKDPGF